MLKFLNVNETVFLKVNSYFCTSNFHLYHSYALLAANIQATGYVVQYTGVTSDVVPDDTINNPEVLSDAFAATGTAPHNALNSSMSQSQSNYFIDAKGIGERTESGISDITAFSQSMDLDTPAFDKGDFKPTFRKQDSAGSVKFSTIYEESDASIDGSKKSFIDKIDIAARSVDYTISGAHPGSGGSVEVQKAPKPPSRQNSIAERAAMLGGKLGSSSQQSMTSAPSVGLEPAASVDYTISEAHPDSGGGVDVQKAPKPPSRQNSIAERAVMLGGKLGSISMTSIQSNGDESAATSDVPKGVGEKAQLQSKLEAASTSQQSISNALPQTGGTTVAKGGANKKISIKERAAKLNLMND